MATTKKLSKVDINKLTPAEVDKMSHEALRDAVRSVIRDPNLAASHRDHRSHSSVADRVLADKAINPAINPVATKTAIKPGTKTGGKG